MPVNREPPVAGARRVSFDYDAADALLAWAASGLPTSVSEQIAALDVAVADAQEDWQGYFRDEFDRASANLRERLGVAVSWGDTGLVQSVFTAAADANDRQQQYNATAIAAQQAAEEAAAEAAANGGGGGGGGGGGSPAQVN